MVVAGRVYPGSTRRSVVWRRGHVQSLLAKIKLLPLRQAPASTRFRAAANLGNLLLRQCRNYPNLSPCRILPPYCGAGEVIPLRQLPAVMVGKIALGANPTSYIDNL